jgi:hypothetical protein
LEIPVPREFRALFTLVAHEFVKAILSLHGDFKELWGGFILGILGSVFGFDLDALIICDGILDCESSGGKTLLMSLGPHLFNDTMDLDNAHAEFLRDRGFGISTSMVVVYLCSTLIFLERAGQDISWRLDRILQSNPINGGKWFIIVIETELISAHGVSSRCLSVYHATGRPR